MQYFLLLHIWYYAKRQTRPASMPHMPGQRSDGRKVPPQNDCLEQWSIWRLLMAASRILPAHYFGTPQRDWAMRVGYLGKCRHRCKTVASPIRTWSYGEAVRKWTKAIPVPVSSVHRGRQQSWTCDWGGYATQRKFRALNRSSEYLLGRCQVWLS